MASATVPARIHLLLCCETTTDAALGIGIRGKLQYNGYLTVIQGKFCMHSLLLPLLAMVAYAVAAGTVLNRLFHPAGPALKLTFSAACLGLVLHAIHLSSALFTAEGQNFSLLNVSSLVSWLITMAVTLTALRSPLILLLPVVYGVAALLQLGVLVLPQGTQLVKIDQSPMLLLHILVAFIAYVILILATLYSVQVSYISYKLKHKALSMTSQLPPLMQAELLQFRLLLIGTLLLGITLLSGALFTGDWFAKHNLHKNVLSLLAFGVFAMLSWGHARLGWRGKTAISLTLLGSILLTLAYFGSRFVREVLLNGGF
ncbi:cytochrome c biogenesis protein CcsA [Alkalimonas delamerensis]|uniref:Cytochrome c biogenesis protein CcsA n=1 Tax=Alkalimonas delamerensis TaxID=265981 RepID=A0ABT9GLX1_9GAMM|nr:cytochrome c biogenesis protein CcsA [Alkalimonas delamerensis]MDP4527939.1 cytochrome c biogenesis protein CcsA [Alkalimonas delamerensis]